MKRRQNQVGRDGVSHAPSDDLPREQIDNHGYMEPALKRVDVRNIGDPYTIRSGSGEILLQMVRRNNGWLREPIPRFAISPMSPDPIAPHELRHTILATAFA